MRNNSQQWAAVGRQLREWQTSESDAAAWKNVCARLEQTHETNGFTIATTAAGALPFFAQMRTIDQSGLCDRHTAKVESDPWMLDRPGHMKQATTRWIAECRPHLVFWHPQIGDCGSGPHSQPPTADYEPRALDVPELAEEGLCVYCWVRKDLVALLEPLGVVSLKESASLSTKEEGEPATSSDGTNASSTNAAGSNAATSSKGTKHRTGRKPRHVLAKEAFEAELKADLAKLDQEGLPPAPTVDPPPAAPRSGPTFTTTRLHAADPASDEARWSVDDVSRPLAASATADPKTASDEFDVTGAPGSFLEFEVASAPTFETRDVTEEVVDPKDPKGAKTTVTKRKEFTKQLAGVVAPKSVAVALVVGGARHELKPRVSELPFARSRCWHTVHADLAGVPAGKARLEVAVDGKALGKGSGWLATVPRICQEVETPKKRPNVLIVTIDTLRADYLGCYGHDRPTSPNIDAFAAKSVLFEHDVAQAPWTLPSYSSFFSGLYCESHGVVHRDHKLGGSFVTFLEKLAQNGYATGAVVSGTFTDSFWGFDQGFDSYDDLGMVVDESHPDAAATSSGAAVTETEAMKAAAHRRVTSPEVANKAIAWLDAHRDQRFALFVHFFDPHEDYVFHPGVSERFPPRPEPSDFPNAVDARRDVTRLMRARYEGEIAYTDQHVGRVLARLEQLGLADDTVVVLFGDHGEAFNEHNLDPEHPENWKKNLGHGGSLFNEQVHVPLIVRVPGVAPGRVASPTGTIDVGPTLLELCGVDDSGWTHQGESLKPMLEDKSAVRGAPVLTAQYVMQPPADLPPATAAETRVQLSHRLDRGDLCAIEWEPRGRELGARFLFDRAAQWQDYAHDLRTSSDSAVAAKASRDFAQFHDYYEKRRGELEALVRKANVLLLDTVDTALKNLGYTNGK
jgi:arylsulfatase A-like enzyme